MGNYNKKEYIIRSYKGSRELYNYFWKLTERLNLDDSNPAQKTLRKAYHKLLVHIFVGTKVRKKRNKQAGIEVEIPVSWELIARKLHRRIRVQKLRECGLIQIKGHFHGPQGGKSREYRLSYKVFEKAIQLEADLFITNWSDLITKSKVPSMVDIFTGKNKYTSQQTQVSLYSNSIKFYNIPDLIKNSIKNSLAPFPFNPHKIIPWLEKIRSMKWTPSQGQ